MGERVRRHSKAIAVLLWGLGALSGCLVDDDQRCGTNQTYVAEQTACVCAPGNVRNGNSCAPCGANEEIVDGKCACKAGFKADATKACVAVPAGLGTACSATMPCIDATYSYCAPGKGGAGYCTKAGCTKNEDCGGGYTCTTWETMPYCKEPPTGIGDPCATDADCAGKDANHCESFMSKTCVVMGCTLAPSNCAVGTKCCDFSMFQAPTLCLAACPF